MSLQTSTVCIIGMGLIGGSMGMAWKAMGSVKRVIGVTRKKESLKGAVELGACDEATTDLFWAAANSDLIIVATPVTSIVPIVTEIIPYLKPGTVISDVGSTKSMVCQKLWDICPENIEFIGGHPMAGSERTGILAADRYLFQNAIYVITPRPNRIESNPGLTFIQELVTHLGAQPIIMDPEEHDLCVAAVSHLPHLVAASLVNTAHQIDQKVPKTLELAASGFRDTTRIASGSPEIWKDICLSNREALLDSLVIFQKTLNSFIEAVNSGDEYTLLDIFQRAKQTRQQIPTKTKGLLAPLCELIVELVDRPGELAKVTGILANEQINIKDIEILHIREGEGGTLRLGFEDESTKEEANMVLIKAGYKSRSR